MASLVPFSGHIHSHHTHTLSLLRNSTPQANKQFNSNMRYQLLLLPALACLASANEDSTAGAVSVADHPAATPDAIPLEDLRDIPVPTYKTATGVTAQEIPYATSAAMSSVSAQVAATPLSVFPAATDVPINAAGSADDNASADHQNNGNDNVIKNSGSKLKRDPSGVARQPRRRAACAPQPTISNTYNVNVDTAEKFRADTTIASVANNANPTPSGYFQNFKNLKGANSAMNYLGYTVVNNGYDVDFCAAKCDAQSGCLAFNIYFERDPTLEPGPGCKNPAAFANIKCSFWGTGLDSTTANNYGQWREKFQVAVAGSNAYTSYKLGGPIDGWNGPQKLNNSVMNAPLWDCTNKWSHLGYKLLQAGSVDPRLCAAACDSQTEYNTAHPAEGAAPVTCNAFGSYILTKNNATGSYQQGQMCTFYTAYWDQKFAVNTASYDDAIGAKYNYTYSSFYGKKNVRPACGAEFVSSYGTYVQGGRDPNASP
ncbi:hypothetical protein Q7P37_008200 [Cladosporium fusiforme]